MSDPVAELSIYVAQDPTVNWTFTSSVDLAHQNWNAASGLGGDAPFRKVSIIITPSGTSPTSYQLKMQSSSDDGAWADEVLVLEVAAGAGTARATIITLLDEDGTVLADRSITLHFERAARRFVRWALRKTGGAGTDRLQVSRAMARR